MIDLVGNRGRLLFIWLRLNYQYIIFSFRSHLRNQLWFLSFNRISKYFISLITIIALLILCLLNVSRHLYVIFFGLVIFFAPNLVGQKTLITCFQKYLSVVRGIWFAFHFSMVEDFCLFNRFRNGILFLYDVFLNHNLLNCSDIKCSSL